MLANPIRQILRLADSLTLMPSLLRLRLWKPLEDSASYTILNLIGTSPSRSISSFIDRGYIAATIYVLERPFTHRTLRFSLPFLIYHRPKRHTLQRSSMPYRLTRSSCHR